MVVAVRTVLPGIKIVVDQNGQPPSENATKLPLYCGCLKGLEMVDALRLPSHVAEIAEIAFERSWPQQTVLFCISTVYGVATSPKM